MAPLDKETLEAQINAKSTERMKIIREIESISATINTHNEELKELQSKIPVMNQRSLDLKVEVEQLEKLVAQLAE